MNHPGPDNFTTFHDLRRAIKLAKRIYAKVLWLDSIHHVHISRPEAEQLVANAYRTAGSMFNKIVSLGITQDGDLYLDSIVEK